jgi:hypothetical protein
MRTIIVLAFLSILISCSRKDSITRFGEENKMDRQYYLYPSTLRMVNLEKDEEYYDMVEGFKKGVFYSLSSTPENSALVKKLQHDLIKEGYEEAMQYRSGEQNVTVYVWDKKTPKIAAILKSDSTFNVMQMEGMIHIVKIPELLESFDKADFIMLPDMIKVSKNPQNVEDHSQN